MEEGEADKSDTEMDNKSENGKRLVNNSALIILIGVYGYQKSILSLE